MIFVTVGYQMSFDRLVMAVDEWAGRNPELEFFAQIGPTDSRPAHLPFTEFMDPEEFRDRIQKASLVISHAGMGSILTAMEFQTPILIMPRLGDLHETRNDHQVATVQKMAGRHGIMTAMDPSELFTILDRGGFSERPEEISSAANPELLEYLRGFIRGD